VILEGERERERNGRMREALGSLEKLWSSLIYALRWLPTR